MYFVIFVYFLKVIMRPRQLSCVHSKLLPNVDILAYVLNYTASFSYFKLCFLTIYIVTGDATETIKLICQYNINIIYGYITCTGTEKNDHRHKIEGPHTNTSLQKSVLISSGICIRLQERHISFELHAYKFIMVIGPLSIFILITVKNGKKIMIFTEQTISHLAQRV